MTLLAVVSGLHGSDDTGLYGSESVAGTDGIEDDQWRLPCGQVSLALIDYRADGDVVSDESM